MDHSFNHIPIPLDVQKEILHFIKNGWFSCDHYHKGSCTEYAIMKCLKVLRISAKIYLPIHIIPLLLYKRGQLKKRPISTLARATYNFSKSVCFVGIMAGIMIFVLCGVKNIRGRMDWINTFLAGSISALGLLLESHGRRHEIFLFGLPRGLEILAKRVKKHQLKGGIPHVDTLVFAIIMAVLHYSYQHDPKTVKQTVRNLMSTFWGNN